MSFISYAQNLEDVMLWRALKHIDRGLYVDVGAAWPDEHSVTKAFYENGWRGINIEPNPVHYSKLKQQRPRDINLNVAISDTSGSLEMSFIEDTGLSTLDFEIAKMHQAAGWGIKKERVVVKSLEQVWQEHIPQGQAVHFLKIDIEGLEEAAIRGNDWAHNRPWIVVVEATLPMSQIESHQTWEPMLIKAGYLFAYADGLNRFYIAEEHNELEEAFKYPPNVFDEYSFASQVDADRRATVATSSLDQAVQRADLAESRATQAWDQVQIVIGKANHAIEQAGVAISQSITAIERADQAEAQAAQANEQLTTAENELSSIKSRFKILMEELSASQNTASSLRHELKDKQAALIRTEEKLEQLDNTISDLKQSEHNWWAQAHELSQKVHELSNSNHHWWTTTNELKQELLAIRSSTSWKISAPIRLASRILQRIQSPFKRRYKHASAPKEDIPLHAPYLDEEPAQCILDNNDTELHSDNNRIQNIIKRLNACK